MRIFIMLSLIYLSVRAAEDPFAALDADHASLQAKIAQLDIMQKTLADFKESGDSEAAVVEGVEHLAIGGGAYPLDQEEVTKSVIVLQATLLQDLLAFVEKLQALVASTPKESDEATKLVTLTSWVNNTLKSLCGV